MQEKSQGEIKLLHEEIEAIFLMDYLDLYQEEAAQKMNISRPTFSRIIKNARKKVASALILGVNLEIQNEKDDFIVALCTDDADTIQKLSPYEKKIVLVHIQNQQIHQVETMDNPVYNEKNKPAMVLPTLFQEKKVNFFLTKEIGEGLKNSLLAKGIFVIEREIKEISEIIPLISQ